MNTQRRHLLIAGALATALPRAFSDSAAAQWPSKPLHLLTGGTGSPADVRARWLADRLARALGQPVVVENKAGAGGNIAAEAGAHSAPDGYTLTIVHQGTMAINPHLYPRLGYDPLADFAPLTVMGIGPLVLTVHPSLPVQSLAELIQLGKSKPGALTFGSPGIGTPPHLASELFIRAAGIEALHVPYKSGGALMTALLGGQISWSMDGPAVQAPFIKAAKVRALAVSGKRRLASLLDIPTVEEAGVAGYEYQGWTGIAAPAGTPQPVLDRLHAEIAKILQSDEAIEWFRSLGSETGLQSREEFAAFIRSEYAKMGRLIRDAGIHVT